MEEKTGNSPLFDAGRRPRRTTEPEARGVDAPRPDTSRTPRRAGEGKGGHRPGPEPRAAAKAASMARTHPLRFLSTMAGIMIASSPFFAAPASADPLTLTTLRKPHVDDAKDAVAPIMKSVWASEIAATPGSFSFTYALFELGGSRYIVSAFRSGSACRPDECDWQVQRLTADYKVAAQGERFAACGAQNGVTIEGKKLLICGQEASLP